MTLNLATRVADTSPTPRAKPRSTAQKRRPNATKRTTTPADKTATAPPCESIKGLVYCDDRGPGLRRVRGKDGEFQYVDADGRRVHDEATLARIRALAIPPAYEDVWICPMENGHIQATARDARGRKQYRYHPEWTANRNANKFQQLALFGASLPRIRRRVQQDLARPGLPPERVLALVVTLLERTLIRIGSDEYARQNRSYGLTTLSRRHTKVDGSQIRLTFTGKSGVAHDITVRDRRLARLVRQCMEIPGQRLFQYRDESGQRRAVDSSMVNDYLRAACAQDFTAKHYRTWAASVYAFDLLRSNPQASVPEVIKTVASRLANTPSVCRNCYVHPSVLEAHAAAALPCKGSAPRSPKGLSVAERRFLAFLANQTFSGSGSGMTT
ncbi:DNA topoisomerase IB [Bordetella sp. 02P26C-1]|uniref:DNA topoisomerase IB n=1 Tax=Bordetella sp. 02P26C-1 TaxID=2683195 RepID=UPI0013546229|nr:DNA topoisomerase IB [Bordetella sp. 02P26C-1]MVW79876.1 DNA topoisomerase IB [Bordetella sp. 02P26C-1]